MIHKNVLRICDLLQLRDKTLMLLLPIDGDPACLALFPKDVGSALPLKAYSEDLFYMEDEYAQQDVESPADIVRIYRLKPDYWTYCNGVPYYGMYETDRHDLVWQRKFSDYEWRTFDLSRHMARVAREAAMSMPAAQYIGDLVTDAKRERPLLFPNRMNGKRIRFDVDAGYQTVQYDMDKHEVLREINPDAPPIAFGVNEFGSLRNIVGRAVMLEDTIETPTLNQEAVETVEFFQFEQRLKKDNAFADEVSAKWEAFEKFERGEYGK